MSPLVPQGPPQDVAPATHGRMARTFYLYRMVRSAVTLVVLLAIALATGLGGARWWVPVLAVVAAVMMALRMWQTHRRWQRAQASFEV